MIMRRLIFCLALVLVAGMTSQTKADGNDGNHRRRVRIHLSGFNEVHFAGGALRGAVSTAARGKFIAMLDPQQGLIQYELSYEGLEGNVTQAHIHFGQQHTVGGIVVWLCQTTVNPAPDAVSSLTPGCPAAGTVTGTITPSQVLSATGQGLDAEEFDELVRAIDAGVAYVNVHSSVFLPGEIRGQFPGDFRD